jgi:hypothetical protein
MLSTKHLSRPRAGAPVQARYPPRAFLTRPAEAELLQCRRNGLSAASLTALQQEPRHFLDEQRHAARMLCQAVNHFLWQRMACCKFTEHVPHVSAIKRSKKNCAVMRADAPKKAGTQGGQ